MMSAESSSRLKAKSTWSLHTYVHDRINFIVNLVLKKQMQFFKKKTRWPFSYLKVVHFLLKGKENLVICLLTYLFKELKNVINGFKGTYFRNNLTVLTMFDVIIATLIPKLVIPINFIRVVLAK